MSTTASKSSASKPPTSKSKPTSKSRPTPKSQATQNSEDSASKSDINIAVLIGSLSSDPAVRELPSGDVVCSYELTCRCEQSGTQTVPVAWFNAPERRQKLRAGDTVIVLGHVRRRFFRAGGATASRTEVVTDRVVRKTPAAVRQVALALRKAADVVERG